MKAALILALVTAFASAQSNETPVYVEQFTNLLASMDRISAECANASGNRDERIAISERLFALTKVAHRLQEQVGEVNSEIIRRGKRPDKRLRLIELGAMSIDSAVTSMGSYLETDDKLFWIIAVDFRKTADTIKKGL